MAPANFNRGELLKRYNLPTEEVMSCICWNNVFYVTGTDIVRCLTYRFEAFGRVIRNRKKFEEGIFSDLRNLKCDSDAILEEPKSQFLDFLYKNNCVRTQKKQKVFHWFSVGHDRLFLDALERDLKKESCGKKASTEAVGEPALSFKYDSTQTLHDQLAHIIDGIPKPLADIADVSTSNYLAGQYPFGALDVGTNLNAAAAAALIDGQGLIRRSHVGPALANGGMPYLAPAPIYLQSQTQFLPQQMPIMVPNNSNTVVPYHPGNGYGYSNLQNGYYLPDNSNGGALTEESYVNTPSLEINTQHSNVMGKTTSIEEPILVKTDVESDFPLDYFHDSTSSNGHVYHPQHTSQPLMVNTQLTGNNILIQQRGQPYLFEESKQDSAESEYQSELEAHFNSETRKPESAPASSYPAHISQADKSIIPMTTASSSLLSAGGQSNDIKINDISNLRPSYSIDEVEYFYGKNNDNNDDGYPSIQHNPQDEEPNTESATMSNYPKKQRTRVISNGINTSSHRVNKGTNPHHERVHVDRLEKRLDRAYYPTPSESGASDISIHKIEPDDRRKNQRTGLLAHDIVIGDGDNNIIEDRNGIIVTNNDDYQSAVTAAAYNHAYSTLDADYWQRY